MIELRNGRVSLALHEVQEGQGTPLLLLHELGSSAQQVGGSFAALDVRWPGPVHALDLSGHGFSGRVHGGGYYPELWAADADSALALLQPQHGRVALLGYGLSAYVALLLAGARPELLCAVLCKGEGLFGSEDDPRTRPPRFPDIGTSERAPGLQRTPSTDPSVHEGQDCYVRPPDYAARFAARRAEGTQLVLVEDGGARPAWWRAVAEVAGIRIETDACAALRSAGAS
jgi:pimeloyl-ACP methyl ester carboxylesterase